MDLTKRQQEIFDFIKRYSARVRLSADGARHRQGRRPGLLVDGARAPRQPREARRCCGATRPSRARSSCSTASAAASSRSGDGRTCAAWCARGLPLVGQVAAGSPILAEENIEDYVQVPPIAGGDEGEYVLRIRGESMKDAGILEGDYVVVRPQETADDGEIVVALVGEEATVKRFFRETDHVRLQPENETMEPIRSKEVQRPRARRRALPERDMTTLTLALRLRRRPRTATGAPATSARAAGRRRSTTWSSAPGRASRAPSGPVPDLQRDDEPRYGSGPRPVGGRCDGCGTRAGLTRAEPRVDRRAIRAQVTAPEGPMQDGMPPVTVRIAARPPAVALLALACGRRGACTPRRPRLRAGPRQRETGRPPRDPAARSRALRPLAAVHVASPRRHPGPPGLAAAQRPRRVVGHHALRAARPRQLQPPRRRPCARTGIWT